MMAGTGHRAWLRWTIAPLAVAAALGATVASAQSLTTDTPQVLGDVAVQANPDGTASLVTTGADFLGADLLVGQAHADHARWSAYIRLCQGLSGHAGLRQNPAGRVPGGS